MPEINIQVVNDYNNTEELLKKFPVIHPTPVYTQMEKNIQNRLLTGFENWNRGFDAWKAWGDILYTPDSLYNVHAVHLTLTEYQNSMKATLRANNILMGDFQHMVIVDDWCAIHYAISTINRETGKETPGSVMEFVHFGDMGPELGTRVIEGWAGTKGPDYPMLAYFQTEEERAAQKVLMESVAATIIPDTDDLEQKYPILHPTTVRTEKEKQMKALILQDFEQWNQGYEVWSVWAESYYAEHLAWHRDADTRTRKEYIGCEADNRAKRLYFDSMLLSGDWAAIHYRTVENKEAGSRMQFLHFEEVGNQLKVTECWTK